MSVDDREPGDLARRISHAVRSPLGVVTGALHQNHEDLDPALRKRMLDLAARATAQIEALADRLTLMGRLQAELEPAMVACDVGELVAAAVTPVRKLRARRGVEVIVDAAPKKARVVGDVQLLAAAIGELVDNAIRFAKSKVHIEVTTHDDSVSVRVEDDGESLEPDEVAAAWTRERPLADRAGLGIGLWIAHAVAKRHRGTVQLAEATPRTVFSLTIPKATSDSAQV